MDKDFKELKDSIDKLTKALTGKFGGASVKPTYANAKPKQGQQENDHVDEADEAFDELSKAVLHQRQVAQDSALTFSNLTKNMKTIFRPIDNLRDAFEDMKDKLADNTRGMSDDYRKLSADTFDAFKTIITQGKDFGSELSKMGAAQKQFVIALENASKAAAAVNEYDGKVGSASAAKEAKQKEYDAARERMLAAETPKQQKSTSAEVKKISEELEALDKTLKNEMNERDKFNDALVASNGILKDGFAEMERLQAMGINLIGAMNKEEINTIKAEKLAGTSAINLSNALKKANANVPAITNAAAAAGGAIPTAVLSRNAGIAKGLEEGIGAFIKQGVPQLVKDMQSRKYYGNGEALGSQDILDINGLSEAQRTDLIGKNQRAFRVMGNGDQNAPFKNGLMAEVSGNLRARYGYSAEDANKKVTEYANNLIDSGFTPTTKTLKIFSDNIETTARILGEAPDTIQNFYDELSKTGQMGILQQAFASKPEAERLDLIQKNSAALMSVYRNLGLNAEQMKQMNQRALNQKYAGLESAIRGQISNSMIVNRYNKMNPNDQVSEDQYALGKDANIQAGYLSQAKTDEERNRRNEEIKIATEKRLKVDSQYGTELNAAYDNTGKDFSNTRVRASNSTISYQIAASIGGRNLQDETEEAMEQTRQRAGMKIDSNNGVQDQAIAGQTRGMTPFDISLGKLDSAITPATKDLNSLGEAARRLYDVFDTISKNPLGAASEGLAQAGFHFAEGALALKGLQGVAGGGAAGGGGLLSRLFGIGGAGASGAAGAAGASGGALLSRLAGPLGFLGYGAYKGYSAEQNSNADLAKNMGVTAPTTKVMQDKLKNQAGQDAFLKGTLGSGAGLLDKAFEYSPTTMVMDKLSKMTGINALGWHPNFESKIDAGLNWAKNKDLTNAGFVTPDDMKNKDGIIDKMMKEKMLGSIGHNGIDADDSLREMLANKSITPDDLVKHGMTPDDIKKIVAGMDADKATDLAVDYLKKIYNVLDDTKDIHEEKNKKDLEHMTFAEWNAQNTASRLRTNVQQRQNLAENPASTPK